jgi:hypothetical protein
LQKWRFPNVLRELDRTTLALRQMMREQCGADDSGTVLFNVAAYRMFNRPKHARWFNTYNEFEHYIMLAKPPLYTGALERGVLAPDLLALAVVWATRGTLAGFDTMEGLTKRLAETHPAITMFRAYQIACDLRHELKRYTDVDSFVPRLPVVGDTLEYLGLLQAAGTVRKLYQDALDDLPETITACPYAAFALSDLVHSMFGFAHYRASASRQLFVGRLP